VFDTRPALTDMAERIRSCRVADGLTLQQLASRSGVAASTIHKVESQQMVPTVSVLLKIAKGLGRRPEELVRDEMAIPKPASSAPRTPVFDDRTIRSEASHRASVRRIDVAQDRPFPTVDLDFGQRAIILVEQGGVHLQAGEESFALQAGDCIEIEGGRTIEALGEQREAASVTLIVSPEGSLGHSLGASTTRPSPQTSPRRQGLGSIVDRSHPRSESDLNSDCR
jgi:transcriptional regulator with XRE-family HTH domain